MSRTMNSRQWTQGHIYTPQIAAPQTIPAEPYYFVEFDRNNQTVIINDVTTSASIVELRAFITTAKTFNAETLPGSGVYRLTTAQLCQMRAAADEAKREYRASIVF